MKILFLVLTLFLAFGIFALFKKKKELSKVLFSVSLTIFILLELVSIYFLLFWSILGYNS